MLLLVLFMVERRIYMCTVKEVSILNICEMFLSNASEIFKLLLLHIQTELISFDFLIQDVESAADIVLWGSLFPLLRDDSFLPSEWCPQLNSAFSNLITSKLLGFNSCYLPKLGKAPKMAFLLWQEVSMSAYLLAANLHKPFFAFPLSIHICWRKVPFLTFSFP